MLLAAALGLAAFRPGREWLDVGGAPIDAHGGGLLAHGGRYYWYGSARRGHPCDGGTCRDGGIHLYVSSDLYAWRFAGRVIAPSNGSATGNGLDLERPKVLRCPATGKFVMWLRGTGRGNTPQLLAVFAADAPTGPFRAAGNASDPFHTVFPGNRNLPAGYQFADATLHQEASGRAFVYWRTRVNPQRTGFRAMQLSDDYLSVVPSSDTQLFPTADREAPAAFEHGGRHYLWTSGTEGWSACAAYLYVGDGPLGPFDRGLGRGWHAYDKPPGFNASAPAWRARDGYLAKGDEWGDAREATLPRAEAACAAAAACAGFTFRAPSRAPPAAARLNVSFKTRIRFVADEGAGLQPPPIPRPGEPGNRKADGQPGAWAFGSQSTYILPNPAFVPGSARAQFVYMADRWAPNTEAFGTYVWLPLFIDPRNGSRVSVVWHDEWTLDGAASPYVRA